LGIAGVISALMGYFRHGRSFKRIFVENGGDNLNLNQGNLRGHPIFSSFKMVRVIL
jgi:hypothetical protein